MEDGVLAVEVVRREVCTSAEPDHVALLDAAEVRVGGRDHRRARMQDERHPAGPERGAGAGHVAGQLGRELAVDVAPVDSRLLEDRAALEHAGDPASPAWPLPGVGTELLAAVDLRELGADIGLQLVEELRSAIEEVRHARMLPFTRDARRCRLRSA